MAKIIILGAGSMGTAFSYPCSDNNHDVTIIGTHLEDDFIDLINSQKKHPILDCNIAKNVKFLKLKSLNEEINKKVDLIVVAVISKGIEWASLQLCKVLKNDVPILNLNDSVLSVEAFVIGFAKEKFKGPIGVNQSTLIPVELLILFESSIESL